jgi:diadenosine tetraphosphate (Ap4A) HIT family hydrolase
MTVTKLLGVAAVGAMLAMAAPAERAQAMSLASPGTAAAVNQGAAAPTTEVRWHRHWHPHWRPHRWHRWHRRHW